MTKKKTFVDGRYYRFIVQTLSDAGIRYLNVEAFTTMLAILSCIFSVMIYPLIRNTFTSIILGVLFYIVVIIVIYTFSVQYSVRNALMILDAKDIIVSSIDEGFIGSVETNINGIPKEVRPAFQQFLTDCRMMPNYELALTSLYLKLGDYFEDMYRLALTYQNNAYRGAADEFSDITQANTRLRVNLLAMQRDSSKLIMEYFMCVGVVLLVLAFTMGGDEAAWEAVLRTAMGNVILVVNIIVCLISYCLMQFFAQGLGKRGVGR